MNVLKITLFSLFLVSLSQMSTAQLTVTSPNQGNRGQTLPIIISGAAGSFAQGTNTSIWIQQGSFTISSGTSTQGGITNINVLSPTDVSADLTIPQNAPLGMYDVGVWSQGTSVFGSSLFEVKSGTATNVTLKVGGGKPGDILNEEVTYTGIDLTGQTITKMWLSKDGNTITSLSNATVVLKDTKVGVDIQIPTGAAPGYWNTNIITSTGQILMSPAVFLVDAAFTVIDNNLNNGAFTLYPNPATDYLKIHFDHDNVKLIQLRVVDSKGTEVLRVHQNTGEKVVSLNISKLKSGTYFLQILEGNKVLSTQKWIKN